MDILRSAETGLMAGIEMVTKVLNKDGGGKVISLEAIKRSNIIHNIMKMGYSWKSVRCRLL